VNSEDFTLKAWHITTDWRSGSTHPHIANGYETGENNALNGYVLTVNSAHVSLRSRFLPSNFLARVCLNHGGLPISASIDLHIAFSSRLSLESLAFALPRVWFLPQHPLKTQF
jgi:hypothetical protein